MSPRPSNKGNLRGKTHIRTVIPSPLHYFLLISLQFSKWPRISNGSSLLLWPVFLTLAKKSPCVGYNIKKFGFVNNVRCAFLTEWVVDDDDRAFGVAALHYVMMWDNSELQRCTSKQTLIDTLWTSSKYYSVVLHPDIIQHTSLCLKSNLSLISQSM